MTRVKPSPGKWKRGSTKSEMKKNTMRTEDNIKRKPEEAASGIEIEKKLQRETKPKGKIKGKAKSKATQSDKKRQGQGQA